MREAYESADFPAALTAAQRAERASNLTRDDLLQLFELRALVRSAVGDREGYEADLQRLASLEPAHSFGRDAPPEVTTDFAAARVRNGGALTVSASAEAGERGAAVLVAIRHDAVGLVTSLRLATRTAGGAWGEQVLTAPSPAQAEWEHRARVPVPDGETLEFVVEAIGPAGALIASSGSRDDPATFAMPEHGDAANVAIVPVGGEGDDRDAGDGGVDQEEGRRRGGSRALVWIGVISGVVLVGALVTALIVTGSDGGTNDHTQPSAPVFTF